MKKFMIALVAMFAMTMSVNAQSNNDNNESHVTAAMAQFGSSMEAIYKLQDPAKGMEAWAKVKANHENRMKKVLDEKQYQKYMQMFELTAKNAAERIAKEQTLANK